AGSRRADRGTQPRGDRALRLVTLHARSQAQGPAAPHQDSDAVPVGDRRSHPHGSLWAHLLRGDPGRALRNDRTRRPLSAHRAAGGFRPPGRRLHARISLMRVYHFSEHPYPGAWDDPHGYLRVNLPNRAIDPKIAADLFHRYHDEYLLATT